MDANSRKRLRWSGVVLVGIGVTVASVALYPQLREHRTVVPDCGLPHAASVSDVVRLLIRAETEDRLNWDRRGATGNSHITGLADRQLWERAYPVRYAQERVFLLGREAIDPLLEEISRSAPQSSTSEVAWHILVGFDDPRIRSAVLLQLKSKRLAPWDAALLLSSHVPIQPGDLRLADERIIPWLEDTADISHEAFCLRLLDEIMKSDQSIGYSSAQILRFLNRLYGVDVDEWLTQMAPDALAFRNRELARGYDPVIAFSRLRANIRSGSVDEGIKAIFGEPIDQGACHRLLDATQGYSVSPIRITSTRGWEARTREWYWQHRDQLRYDWSKHRFAVGPSPTSRASGRGS